MVKIFSGDDTNFRDDQRLALTFAAPDVDFTGCTAELEFLGHRRVFPSVSDGGRLSFSFSADETRGMPVGVHRVTICLRDASGRVRTIDNTQRIKVTDDVNEAYGDAEQELKVSVVGASGGASLPEIPNDLAAVPGDNVGDFKAKFNRLLAVLRGVAVVLAVLALPCIVCGAAPKYALHDNIPGTQLVLTNTAEYVAATVTNVVRDTVGTVWDDALGVAWQARMHNGHLYYIAVTNRQEVTE